MRIWERESCVYFLFRTPWHLSKGKIESHLANTLFQWPMRTISLKKIITGDETRCFAYHPDTKRQSSEWVGETYPRPKKLKFQMSHIKIRFIILFDSQGVVNKKFVSEGKTLNAKMYKGVMDLLLKRFRGGLSSCDLLSRFFLFCTIVRPPTKLHVFANFLPAPPKELQPFIAPRTLQIYLHQTIFCSPRWKWI
jgi:hypothetical protein